MPLSQSHSAAAPWWAPGSGATGAAPTHSLQTGVETQIEQGGQSHTGHGRAGTATGFPQPRLGLSRTLLCLLSSILFCSFCLQRE